MRGDLLLVLLLVLLPATGAAQTTDKKPAAEHAAGAEKTQAKKKEAVNGQNKKAHAKTKAPQEGTEGQPETKKTQGEAEAAQVKTETGQTEEAQAQTDKEPKLTPVPGGNALGMSVLGNQEAPTSLVIVPWKSSEVGRATGISPMLDDSRQPVDKEVFMRELRYYEIRSEKKP
jgi:hypothetical protein